MVLLPKVIVLWGYYKAHATNLAYDYVWCLHFGFFYLEFPFVVLGYPWYENKDGYDNQLQNEIPTQGLSNVAWSLVAELRCNRLHQADDFQRSFHWSLELLWNSKCMTPHVNAIVWRHLVAWWHELMHSWEKEHVSAAKLIEWLCTFFDTNTWYELGLVDAKLMDSLSISTLLSITSSHISGFGWWPGMSCHDKKRMCFWRCPRCYLRGIVNLGMKLDLIQLHP